jgi:hypothetical protein
LELNLIFNMKNYIVCKNCNTQNPHYQHICISCKSYLRERVVNIDLWNTIGTLVESPAKGFKQVIFSEHKNFIFLIIILASLKLLLDSIFIGVAAGVYDPLSGFFIKYIIMLAALSCFIYLFSVILNIINKRAGYASRVKDYFAIFAYSFFPHVAGLITVFIIELVIFGGYLFSKNPSPFDLKEFLAYTLLVFEFLIIGWGMFLSFMAAFTQTRRIIYSLFVSLLFYLFLFSGLYLFSIIFIK